MSDGFDLDLEAVRLQTVFQNIDVAGDAAGIGGQAEATQAMISTITAPPVFCPRCRRELKFLFCAHCALSDFDDSDLLASAKGIRAIAKRPIRKIGARADCVFCSQSIAAGEHARRLIEGITAHVECIRLLRERLAVRPPGEVGHD